MRKALKRLHLPAGIITGAILFITLVGSGAAWWLNERVPVLEGDVPLMPRSEVVRAEKHTRPAVDIFNYTCKTRHISVQIERFYRSRFGDAGWRVVEEAGKTIQFERNDSVVRLVLHPQRFRTVFTLHIRHPRFKDRKDR